MRNTETSSETSSETPPRLLRDLLRESSETSSETSYRRLGQRPEARAAYARAIDLTRQAPERRFLERRLAEL